MRENKLDKEFQINITYQPGELALIVEWYIENHMPPIYANYNLENEEIANMIEDKAVEKLMEEGSNSVMNSYLGDLVFELSMTDDEDYEQ